MLAQKGDHISVKAGHLQAQLYKTVTEDGYFSRPCVEKKETLVVARKRIVCIILPELIGQQE